MVESNQQDWSAWRTQAVSNNETDVYRSWYNVDALVQDAGAASSGEASIFNQLPLSNEFAANAQSHILEQDDMTGNTEHTGSSSSVGNPHISRPTLLDRMFLLSTGLHETTSSQVDEDTVNAARRVHAELTQWLPASIATSPQPTLSSITTACYCCATAHDGRCQPEDLVTYTPSQLTVTGRITGLREYECWSYCKCSAYITATGAQCDNLVIVRHGHFCMTLLGWQKPGKNKQFLCAKTRH